MKSKKKVVVLCVLLAMAIAAIVAIRISRPPKLYTVTILPSLGGDFTRATGINNRGQVVGFSEVSQADYHLFFWDRDAGMHDLGRFDFRNSVLINDHGQVAGTTTVDADGLRHAFVWDPNSGMHMWGTLRGANSMVCGFNNHGQVVGRYEDANDNGHAFIWDRTAGMRDLVAEGKEFQGASAINDAGQVLVSNTDNVYRAELDEDGEIVRYDPLPVRGAMDMNDNGQVVIRVQLPSGDIFVWDGGSGLQRFSLRPPYLGHARMNDAGQVVFSMAQRKALRLFGRTIRAARCGCYLWDSNLGNDPVEIYVPAGANESIWPTDLNDQGCIVGAIQSSTTERAFLLEPIDRFHGD